MNIEDDVRQQLARTSREAVEEHDQRELEKLAEELSKYAIPRTAAFSSETFGRAMRLLDLRSWLTRFGYSVAQIARACDSFRVSFMGVPLVVHPYEENGDVLQFNDDYSEAHVERNLGAGTSLSLEFVYETRMRVDGVRTALTDSALYIYHPAEAL